MSCRHVAPSSTA